MVPVLVKPPAPVPPRVPPARVAVPPVPARFTAVAVLLFRVPYTLRAL